jgi:enoyl-CoA hydratase/carnithine racemase
MAYQFALYEKKGRIAHVTINRPESMNALHPPANEELSEIWDDFQADDDLWVAILTGTGERAFCAGADLKFMASSGQSGAQTRENSGGFAGIDTRFDLWKPVIAAVNGYCLAGGFETALACDIIIAAEHAQFGMPEPRWGLDAGPTGYHRLVRQIPTKVAMEMLLTGKFITARRAQELGLVNDVVPLEELIPAAERCANEILECAPLSIRGTKQAAYSGLDHPLEIAARLGFEERIKSAASEDRIEGPRAFAAKRLPVWKGR